MNKNDIKEKGRYVAVWEKAQTIREKPGKKAANQAMRIQAVQTAKRQLKETRETVIPAEDNERSYTPVDKVEDMATGAVGEAVRVISPAKNVFHGETHFTATQSDPQTPSDQPHIRDKHRDMEIKTKESVQAAQAQKTQTAKIPTGQRQAALPRNSSSRQVKTIKEQGRRLAQDQALAVVQRTGHAPGQIFKRIGAAIHKTTQAASGSALFAGGGLILLIIPLILIAGVAAALLGSGGSRNGEYTPVSDEVEAYTPIIQIYARQHGIPEYVELIKAVMMQESRGLTSDPMQASESPFNTRYPGEPGGITDPEYSIDVGIQSLVYVMEMAGVKSPIDIEGISLALQGYNYGSGYITWAVGRYGGYSELNAIEYSDMMAARMGWTGYGDKAYVAHVLRFYPLGRLFMSEGGEGFVEIARSQLGNEGGEIYWTWFGCEERVEWCAIFVSWCADQAGYIEDEAIPKFDGVRPGVEWFQERDRWENRDYEPYPGDLIFFDWQNDNLPDHVGIVEKCEDGMVYTIEGNADDVVSQHSYPVNSNAIYGYGLLRF